MSGVHFELQAVDPMSGVRAGLLHTPHGTVPTPTFMPVGTLGTVKALTPADVRHTGAHIVLSNAYHLALQPGAATVKRLGGVHGFMHWEGPMLTDSGGFQVFSLDALRQVSDEGVIFASHLTGEPLLFSPESVIEIQEQLGADLIMPLDECVSSTASRAETERALERTQLWWRRSLSVRSRHDQGLFALIQGGMFDDLRREAGRAAAGEDTPGFAIGGLSVGESKDLTADLLRATTDQLPADKPRYLMGVGHPRDLYTYTRLGVDLFDCVLPTRLGRNGTVWCDEDGNRLDLSRRAMLGRRGPVVEGCTCPTCLHWSVGSLAALFQSRDQLAYRLASMHNLTMLSRIASELRQRVLYTAGQSNASSPMARKASHW